MGAPLETLTAQIDDVLTGYVTAMLWANANCAVPGCPEAEAGTDCEHTREAHHAYGLDDFGAEDQAQMRDEVEAFVLDNLADFRAYVEARTGTSADGSSAGELFGHDFALTRNGHGAGFWDRGLDELGDRLTAASRPYGETHVNVAEESVTL